MPPGAPVKGPIPPAIVLTWAQRLAGTGASKPMPRAGIMRGGVCGRLSPPAAGPGPRYWYPISPPSKTPPIN